VRELRGRLSTADLPGDHRTVARLDLLRALYAQSRFAEVVAEGESLLADPDLAPATRTSAWGVLACAMAIVGRSEDARRLAKAALAAPDADAETRVLARSAVRGVLFLEGRYEAAVDAARAVLELAADAGPVPRAEARLDMGGMLSHVDAFDEAVEWLTLADDAPPHQRTEAATLRATMGFAAGHWAEVLELPPAPSDQGLAADRSELAVTLAAGLRAATWLHLDRLEDARRELHLGPRALAAHPTALAAGGLLAEANGDVGGAAALLERVVTRSEDLPYPPALRTWGPDAVRVALHAGDASTARRTADLLDRAAERTAVPSVLAAADLARGLLERDTDLLQSAVARFAVGPRSLGHAQALEALADTLLGSDRTDAATAAFREAHDRYRALHAERDARRVARRLAANGVRVGRTAGATRDRRGWAALTATERTVAALVAEGLTNARIAERLLVSTRTVESHVGHLLAKLDVPTRAAVARVVAEHPDQPASRRTSADGRLDHQRA
jgi:DNA-binding CsgD family transcriptional regulator